MSYDLAIWTGPRPRDDAAAGEAFERRSEYVEVDDIELAPASPAIAALIADLLDRYPALGTPGDDHSPWATGPAPGEINGDFLYLTMTYPGAEDAVDVIAAIVRRHGLVCYDPQTETLR